MDPITAGVLAATVVPLASGAAGEAGKQAWGSLATFVRQRFGRDSELARATEAFETPGAQATQGDLLSRVLAAEAARDAHVDEWLRAWLDTAAPIAGHPADQPTVTNTISGQAQVNGPVFQGNTFGPIRIDQWTPPDHG